MVRLLVYLMLFICVSCTAGDEAITSPDSTNNVFAQVLCGIFFGPGGGNPTNFPPLPPPSGSAVVPGNGFVNGATNSPGNGFVNGRGGNSNINSFTRNNDNSYINQATRGQASQPVLTNRPSVSDGFATRNNNYPNNGGYNNVASSDNIQQVNNPLIERQFPSATDWYNDWYSRFQPVYMRLTQNVNATPRGLSAANYANGVRMNFVENANSYLSQTGSAPHLFMKNLETRLNVLGTNFPAEWTQVTCGTGFFFHSCGSLRK